MIKSSLSCLVVFLLTGCVTTDVAKSSNLRLNPYIEKDDVVFYHQNSTFKHKTNHVAGAIGHHGATSTRVIEGNVYQNRISLISGTATKKQSPKHQLHVSSMTDPNKQQVCYSGHENQNFSTQICYENDERYYEVIDKRSSSISCRVKLDAKTIFGKENRRFENTSLSSNISEDGNSIYLYSFFRAFGRAVGNEHYPGYIVSKNCKAFTHVVLDDFPDHEVIWVREQEDGLVFLKSFDLYVRYNSREKKSLTFKPRTRSEHIYIDDKYYVSVENRYDFFNLEILDHSSGKSKVIKVAP